MVHEFDAGKYEQASAHQKEWGEKLINELKLEGNERVLDLGCGDGVLTARLAELAARGHVLGIDASQGMIDRARKRQRANLEFRLMDINELNFEDEFDWVFSNATLHWIKDHRTLLENVFRSLKPNGRLRFSFAGAGNCASFFKVVGEALRLPEYAGHFADFEWPWCMPTVSEYEALARRSPFREARVWGENADRYFPHAEAIAAWVEQPSLVPLLPCVPQGERASFKEFVIRRIIEETRQADGRCFETFRRIHLYAAK